MWFSSERGRPRTRSCLSHWPGAVEGELGDDPGVRVEVQVAGPAVGGIPRADPRVARPDVDDRRGRRPRHHDPGHQAPLDPRRGRAVVGAVGHLVDVEDLLRRGHGVRVRPRAPDRVGEQLAVLARDVEPAVGAELHRRRAARGGARELALAERHDAAARPRDAVREEGLVHGAGIVERSRPPAGDVEPAVALRRLDPVTPGRHVAEGAPGANDSQ